MPQSNHVTAACITDSNQSILRMAGGYGPLIPPRAVIT